MIQSVLSGCAPPPPPLESADKQKKRAEVVSEEVSKSVERKVILSISIQRYRSCSGGQFHILPILLFLLLQASLSLSAAAAAVQPSSPSLFLIPSLDFLSVVAVVAADLIVHLSLCSPVNIEYKSAGQRRGRIHQQFTSTTEPAQP